MEDKYIDYISKAQTGDIIFTYNTQSLLNKAICYFTSRKAKHKVAHVGIYLFDGIMAEADWNGIRIKHNNKYKRNKYKIYLGRWKEKLTKKQKDSIIRNAIVKAGMKYSYITLLLHLLKSVFKWKKTVDLEEGKFICPEYTADVWRESDIDFMPNYKNTSDLSPQIIFDEGNLYITEC